MLKQKMYEKYLHEITKSTEDTIDGSFVNVYFINLPLSTVIPRSKHFSLTFRHVPKASKIKIKIRKKEKIYYSGLRQLHHIGIFKARYASSPMDIRDVQLFSWISLRGLILGVMNYIETT
jgi:hypothetical protein